MKILRVLDMKDKIGLVFSHIHVREHERHKFDILEYCINFFNNSSYDFFYVVSGHGVEMPTSIKEKIDNNIERCIKLRASDLTLNTDKIITALDTKKILLSEQTSIERRMIGDLFMAGPTSIVRDLWTENAWDYSKSGLYNLFDNATLLAKKDNMDISQFFKENCVFLSPHEINWVTLDNNWNTTLKKPHKVLDSSDIWGVKQGYQHYGGFE